MMKEVITIALSALSTSLGYYFSKPILFLPSILLIMMTYMITKMPRIKSQEDVNKFLEKYEKKGEEVCNKIVYTHDLSIFGFFPSKTGNNIALVDGKHCIIKKGNEVLIYDTYQGIDEAIKILC
ncbi:hypothetical protein [Acidianus sp. HS-5]|uniref:hypothetical protein n=1 Tax=Acidianus sp. HS-5 TaxID=2886040 RepID=UPI001F313563|nr:hypothetical protein [Acidianus sp. HS-5]BDC17325.1 hypothetical protein HS5_02150 [Acidianus sp. HS-5]